MIFSKKNVITLLAVILISGNIMIDGILSPIRDCIALPGIDAVSLVFRVVRSLGITSDATDWLNIGRSFGTRTGVESFELT